MAMYWNLKYSLLLRSSRTYSNEVGLDFQTVSRPANQLSLVGTGSSSEREPDNVFNRDSVKPNGDKKVGIFGRISTATRDEFHRFLSTLRSPRVLRVLSATFLLALLFTLVVLFWAKGRLLFGEDYTGFYNVYDVIGSSENGLLAVFCILVSGGNIYVGYYLDLLATSFLCATAVFWLSSVLLKDVLSRARYVVGLIAASLYLFNPWSSENSFVSLTYNVSLDNFGFILFLTGAVLAYRRLSVTSLPVREGLIAGIGLGLALDPFPNYFRLWFVSIAILLFLVLMGLLGPFRSLDRRKLFIGMIAFLGLLVVVATLLSVPYIAPWLANPESIISTANSGAAAHSYVGFYSGPFNSFTNEIRGFNSWQFPSISYYRLYTSWSPLAAVSFAWPVCALVLPIILSTKNLRHRVYPIVGALILVILWDKAGNPPVGSIWNYFYNSNSWVYQLLPTGFLSQYSLDILYPILSGLSVYLVGVRLQEVLAKRARTAESRGQDPTHMPEKSTQQYTGLGGRCSYRSHGEASESLTIAIQLAMCVILISAAYPTLAGYDETETYNPTNQVAGFVIPSAYFDVSLYLEHHEGTVLLYPPTGENPYIVTRWGWDGYVGFYNLFFRPTKIVTMDQFGGTYSSSSQWKAYENLTQPLVCPSSGSCSLASSFLPALAGEGVDYILLDSSIYLGLAVTFNYSMSVVDLLISSGLATVVYTESTLTLVSISQSITNEPLEHTLI
jgi:hypothetical protein